MVKFIFRPTKREKVSREKVYSTIEMNLRKFDDKCIRITTASGEVYEGVVSYCSEEYVFHEYGYRQEALLLTPILFYKDNISNIVSLEDVDGPFGHYSEKYGLLEKKCLEWGTDAIEEIFDSEDDIQILRMLTCMNDSFQSLADRAIPGMAPWRSGSSISRSEDAENEEGPIYLGELENMLNMLVKYNRNDEVVIKAKATLDRLVKYFRLWSCQNRCHYAPLQREMLGSCGCEIDVRASICVNCF